VLQDDSPRDFLIDTPMQLSSAAISAATVALTMDPAWPGPASAVEQAILEQNKIEVHPTVD
jgi:hypothetical protein